MWSAGEFLAGNAAPHDVFRVFHGGEPVKTCSECLGHDYSAARVVPAGAFVNFEQ
jgi:hypothetical protein